MPTEPLRDRLRRLRIARGLKRTQLAVASGVSLDTIARIEQGRTLHPGEGTLRLLAGPLGTTLSDLLGEPAAAAPQHARVGATMDDHAERALGQDGADHLARWLARIEAVELDDEARRFLAAEMDWLAGRLEAGRAYEIRRSESPPNGQTSDDNVTE